MQDFKGKVAVITGAGRGIGRGVALRCAQESMKIVLAGIGQESLNKTNADLKALGAETLIVQTDVSRLDDVENLAARSYEAFGSVDLLVNNAGVVVPTATVLETRMEDWNWVIGVNLYGVIHGVHVFLPRMLNQKKPCHVVNVSSRSGITPGGGSYGMTKHAVVVLTETLYHEFAAEENINVSVYCPGTVSSEMYRTDQSRPKRFRNNALETTEEFRAEFKAYLETGMSIEESTQVLFEGIKNNTLYIGAKSFPTSRFGQLDEIVRTRAENMINERNPVLTRT